MASFLLFARWARPARRMGCAVERHFGGGAVTVELARGGFGVTGEFAGDFANLAETPGGVAEFTERVPFEGTFGLYLFDERFFEGVEFGTVFGRDFHDGGGKAVGLGIGGRFGFSGSVREPVECWALAQCRLLCVAERYFAEVQIICWTFSPPLGIVCWMGPPEQLV